MHRYLYKKSSVVFLGIASIGLVLAAAAQGPGKSSAPSTDKPFAAAVKPFLNLYCVKCHGAERQQGRLRLDTLPDTFADPATKAKWTEVVKALNSRQMPPTSEKQPAVDEAGRVIDWLSERLARAEIERRTTHVVLRRLNRSEYNNTIRDLVHVDFRPADRFPDDPPAGGFDNIGQALTVSPLHLEMYYAAARQILDRALVQGTQPPVLKWRFEPEQNTKGIDAFRVTRDGQNILLNKGENPVENGFTVIHHDSWNKAIDFRGFTLPYEGDYIVRFRAAGRVPTRAQVVTSAGRILKQRYDEEVAGNPGNRASAQEQMDTDLKHFKTHRMYDYGPPRIKITQNLGGTPGVIAEMDVDAPLSAPRTYEVRAHFTKQDAGIEMHYAYDIPRELENFWMQDKDGFARPELLVDWVELEGPIYTSWPPPSHRAILGDAGAPVGPAAEMTAARTMLSRFMTRAYRRPVTAPEVEAKVALFRRLRPDKPDFVEAMKPPLAAVLTSPNFLFLAEPVRELAGADGGKLTPYELASRLSYFLWSSMPDDALTRKAASGDLTKPEALKAEVGRMLADPKSDALVKNFAGQWLGLRKVGSNPPVQSLYPEYDRHLEISMVRESEGFFAEILRNDLDCRNLIKSDFVTINERLARFYGIPGVKGDAVRKVPAPPSAHRGGLVTQASIQTITSNGTRTSPVTRGVWVLRTLLGADPGLPVANVGEIASKVPGIDRATVRQRLQIHRQNPACARCHDKIDPLGFALENYNACGAWRDREGHGYNGRIDADDPIIDTASTMPDGTPIRGVEGLQAQMLKHEDQFLTNLASQMMTYALGRELGFADRSAVAAEVQEMKKRGYTLRALIEAIAASDQFRSR